MDKKIINRIMALTLCFVMLFTSSVFALEPEVNETAAQKFSFTFSNMFDNDQARDVDVYYTDDYFEGSETYNPHLATISLALTMTSSRQNYVNNALSTIGFQDTENTGYNLPSEDGIGVTIANKELSGDAGSLVAVVVRSAGYEDEWIANFNLGTSGDAVGYREPASQIMTAIDSYLENNISGDAVKFWVVGYSRGAAVANIVSKKLSDNADFGKDDVLAYCFEGPMVAFPGDKTYKNIHLIRNVYDGVAVVFPEYMGAGVYGNIENKLGLGSEADMLSMLSNYTDNTSQFASPKGFKWGKLTVDLLSLIGKGGIEKLIKITPAKSNTYTQKDFWDKFLEQAKNVIPNREKYYEYQDGLMNLVRLIRSLEDSQINELKNSVGDCMGKMLADNDVVAILLNALTAIMKDDALSLSNSDYDTLCNSIESNLIDELNSFSAEQKSSAKLALRSLIKPVLQYLDYDYPSSAQTLGTILMDGNIDRIAQSHYFEINLAWLMLQDSYYGTVKEENLVQEIQPSKGGGQGSEGISPTAPSGGNEQVAEDKKEEQQIAVPKKASINKIIRTKNSLTIKWPKSKADGYQIQYSTNKKFKKNNKTKNVSKKNATSKKITGLKSKKTYYIRIRAYNLDKKQHKANGKWSKTIKCRTL